MKIVIVGDDIYLYREDGLTAPSPEMENSKYFKNYWPFAEIGN